MSHITSASVIASVGFSGLGFLVAYAAQGQENVSGVASKQSPVKQVLRVREAVTEVYLSALGDIELSSAQYTSVMEALEGLNTGPDLTPSSISIAEFRRAVDGLRDAKSAQQRSQAADTLKNRAEELVDKLNGEVLPMAARQGMREAAPTFAKAVEAHKDKIYSEDRLVQLRGLQALSDALEDYHDASEAWRAFVRPEGDNAGDDRDVLSNLAYEETKRCLDRLKESNSAANREALTDVLASVLEVMGAEGEARRDFVVADEAPEMGGYLTVGEVMDHLRELDKKVDALALQLGSERDPFGRLGAGVRRFDMFEVAVELLQEPAGIVGGGWPIPGELLEAMSLEGFDAVLEQQEGIDAGQKLERVRELAPAFEAALTELMSELRPAAYDKAAANLLGQLDDETFRAIQDDNQLRALDMMQKLEKSVSQYTDTSEALRVQLAETGQSVEGDRYLISPLAASQIVSAFKNAQLDGGTHETHKRVLIQVLMDLKALLDPSSADVARAEAPNLHGGSEGLYYHRGVESPDERDDGHVTLGALSRDLIAVVGQVAELPALFEALRNGPDEERDQAKDRLRAILTKYFENDIRRREEDLAKIEQRVAKLRDQLQRRREKQEEIVELQLEIAVNEAEGLGFFPAEAADGGRGEAPITRGRIDPEARREFFKAFMREREREESDR